MVLVFTGVSTLVVIVRYDDTENLLSKFLSGWARKEVPLQVHSRPDAW